jgi:hypothetical protein
MPAMRLVMHRHSFWCLISASNPLFVSEIEQPVTIRGYASFAAILGELVWINLDFVNVEPRLAAFKLLLRKELEPFTIGVREIRTRETMKGLIILSGDARQEIGFSDHLRFAPVLLVGTCYRIAKRSE